jgi:NADPH:quinone reductase-like Zn-dependent oxidoreductase
MNTLTLSKLQAPVSHLPMKACRVHRFGPPEVITLDDVAQPAASDGEVLVLVHAAGVGPWDAWIREGKSALPQPLPLTLGSDLSGIVAAVGPNVTEFKAGDSVFGVTNRQFTGAYAEFALASATMITKKPARLGDIDAASVPVVAVTAWQALFDHARLARGQSVLIHGAAGNVGRFAVQLARRAGLRTVATATGDDAAYVQSLGADTVIDFRSTREARVGRVDAVIDLVGGETQARSFVVLKCGGILVSTVSQPDVNAAKRHGTRGLFFLVDVNTASLARIAEMIDSGLLKTNVGAVLPLADARVAHEMIEGVRPHPRGKIVLRVSA